MVPSVRVLTFVHTHAHALIGVWALDLGQTELKKDTPDPLANFEESVYQVFIHLYAQRWVA